ncbi:DUF6479 family protein [Streptomyces sp. NPDC054863]
MHAHGIENTETELASSLASSLASPLAASRDLMVGIAPFVIGLAVVAVLMGGVWLGIRVKKREPAPPRPEEQPRAPERNHPPGEMRENRETAELPQDGVRRTPHQLGGYGNASTRPGD